MNSAEIQRRLEAAANGTTMAELEHQKEQALGMARMFGQIITALYLTLLENIETEHDERVLVVTAEELKAAEGLKTQFIPTEDGGIAILVTPEEGPVERT